jgi:hypothetical protein
MENSRSIPYCASHQLKSMHTILKVRKTFANKKAAFRITPYMGRVTVLKIFLKVIKMLMMVVVAFSLCWLPWQSYFLLSTVYPAINQ